MAVVRSAGRCVSGAYSKTIDGGLERPQRATNSPVAFFSSAWFID